MKHLLCGVALAVLIAAAGPALAAKPAPVGVPIIPPADPAAAKAAASPAPAKPEPSAAAPADPAAKAAASPAPAKSEPSTAAPVSATAIRHDRPVRHRSAWRRAAWRRAARHHRHAWRYQWGRPPRSDSVAEQLNHEELRRVTPVMPSRPPLH